MIYEARPFVDACLRMSPRAKFLIKFIDEKVLIEFYDAPGMGSNGITYILLDGEKCRKVEPYQVKDLTLAAKSIKEF